MGARRDRDIQDGALAGSGEADGGGRRGALRKAALAIAVLAVIAVAIGLSTCALGVFDAGNGNQGEPADGQPSNGGNEGASDNGAASNGANANRGSNESANEDASGDGQGESGSGSTTTTEQLDDESQGQQDDGSDDSGDGGQQSSSEKTVDMSDSAKNIDWSTVPSQLKTTGDTLDRDTLRSVTAEFIPIYYDTSVGATSRAQKVYEYLDVDYVQEKKYSSSLYNDIILNGGIGGFVVPQGATFVSMGEVTIDNAQSGNASVRVDVTYEANSGGETLEDTKRHQFTQTLKVYFNDNYKVKDVKYA